MSTSEVLQKWLDELDLEGVDAVRGRLALALARELDDPEAPRYAKPRLAAVFLAVLAEITASVTPPANGTLDIRALIAEAMR